LQRLIRQQRRTDRRQLGKVVDQMIEVGLGVVDEANHLPRKRVERPVGLLGPFENRRDRVKDQYVFFMALAPVLWAKQQIATNCQFSTFNQGRW